MKMEKYRVVFQLNEEDPLRINLVLSNIRNLIADLGGENLEIELVGYSNGVKIFLHSSEYAEIIDNLMFNGVKFAACSNTLNAMGIKSGRLVKGVEVVSSGIGELVRKQSQGWIYIRP